MSNEMPGNLSEAQTDQKKTVHHEIYGEIIRDEHDPHVLPLTEKQQMLLPLKQRLELDLDVMKSGPIIYDGYQATDQNGLVTPGEELKYSRRKLGVNRDNISYMRRKIENLLATIAKIEEIDDKED